MTTIELIKVSIGLSIMLLFGFLLGWISSMNYYKRSKKQNRKDVEIDMCRNCMQITAIWDDHLCEECHKMYLKNKTS